MSDSDLEAYAKAGIPLPGRAFVRTQTTSDGVAKVFGGFVLAHPFTPEEDAIYEVEVILCKKLGQGRAAVGQRLDQVMTGHLLVEPERMAFDPYPVKPPAKVKRYRDRDRPPARLGHSTARRPKYKKGDIVTIELNDVGIHDGWERVEPDTAGDCYLHGTCEATYVCEDVEERDRLRKMGAGKSIQKWHRIQLPFAVQQRNHPTRPTCEISVITKRIKR